MPHNPATTPSTTRRLPPLLRRAWYSLNQTFRQRIAHLGITPDQYSILRWLQEGDPRGLTQQTLTDLMASDPNTITSILRRMETAKLVTRHPHETDKRARRVCLESEGQRLHYAAFQIATELQEQIISVIPDNRRARFLEDLERVAQASSLAQSEREG
jgi:DNA-binding MarR family transcriptional regulator